MASKEIGSEYDALVNDNVRYGTGAASNPSSGGGVNTPGIGDMAATRKSFLDLKNAIGKESSVPLSRNEGSGMTRALSRSSFMTADGNISYMTPSEMGRQELYEELPMTAVHGLQKKEKDMSMAFSAFAADLDVLEQSMKQIEPMSESEKMKKKSTATLLLMDELQMDSKVMSTSLIGAVIVAAIAQFLVGYNIGVMNAPAAVVFPGHTTFQWAVAVSAFAMGGPFGSNVAGGLADSRGRRGAIILNAWIFLLGGTLQTCAMDMFTIIVARFIIGFASGFSSVIVPVYLGEIAPPTLRGTLGTVTQFAVVIGILVSNLMAFPFAKEGVAFPSSIFSFKNWRFLFLATPVFAMLQLLLAPNVLESPRWLLGRDNNSKKARYNIKKLRGFRFDYEVETEANHYIAAFKVKNQGGNGSEGATNAQATVKELFQDKTVRLLLVSAIVLQMAQQLCGINAVFYYSTGFFEGVIENPLVGTTLVGAVNVLATYVALLLMDSCGRRTLILWSSGGMLLSCVIIVLSLLGYFSKIVALGAVNVYVTFFEIGLGPIPWLIVAEMFDAKYISVAMAVASQINWGSNVVVGLVFPYLQKYLGPYSFGPFGVVLTLTFIFAWIWLPETQGTTPEELLAALVEKNADTVYKDLDVENNYSNPLDMEWKRAMNEIKQDEIEDMNNGNYEI